MFTVQETEAQRGKTASSGHTARMGQESTKPELISSYSSESQRARRLGKRPTYLPSQSQRVHGCCHPPMTFIRLFSGPILCWVLQEQRVIPSRLEWSALHLLSPRKGDWLCDLPGLLQTLITVRKSSGLTSFLPAATPAWFLLAPEVPAYQPGLAGREGARASQGPLLAPESACPLFRPWPAQEA